MFYEFLRMGPSGRFGVTSQHAWSFAEALKEEVEHKLKPGEHIIVRCYDTVEEMLKQASAEPGPERSG